MGSLRGDSRNLHVMTQFEVRTEGESLGHGDVTPGLEHHHCDRSTGEGVTDDKFGDDAKLKSCQWDIEYQGIKRGILQTNLLIGNSLNHTDGDGKYE